MKIEIIKGGVHQDFRGIIQYANDFNMQDINRFYLITHNDIDVVRAWQGHMIEHKYFYVIRGSFIIAGVKIDDWANPSMTLEPQIHKISAIENIILSIPPGYANGLKALEVNSQLMVFSSYNENKNIRFDSSLWMDWNAN